MLLRPLQVQWSRGKGPSQTSVSAEQEGLWAGSGGGNLPEGHGPSPKNSACQSISRLLCP